MKKRLLILLVLITILIYYTIPVSANAPPSSEIDGGDSLLNVLVLIATMASGIAITCVSEWLVALLINVDHRNTRLIILTNIVSQVIMWMLYIGMVNRMGVHKILAITLLEILVYSAESLIYCKLMQNISRAKCLIYTFSANTISLLLGILIIFRP